ncbi:MAG TPA: protease inhibitor I42 family protein [Syntrophorhabdales bacterium]|nr:protease inhibitor I42 family protein [Syntrophorhabdales bacterium]
MRLFAAVFLILLGLAFSCLAETPGAFDTAGEKSSPAAIGRETAWNPDRETLQAVRLKCAEFGGERLDECFTEAMQDAGASAEAASFTKLFGDGTFVRRFKKCGHVDVAYVFHPFRPTENHGILLVNGEPPVVDVDDIALLPKEDIEQDKTYLAIKKSFPRATMWPGDRTTKYPLVEALPEGGQSFIVPYKLRNFCQACEVLGTAFFSFDFDKEGWLTDIRFLRIELPSKKSAANSETRKDNEQISFVVMTEEGKEFTVRLPSDRYAVYRWRVVGAPDERIVKIERSEYVSFDGATSGEEVWTFLAVSRGDTEITMEYAPRHEGAQTPVKTATIKVSVRPASVK